MNKVVPFTKISNKISKIVSPDTSVIVNEKNTPIGFVFGRDSFITFLEHIDESFEEKINDPKKAFDNPAGKLIDLIEEKLPLNPDFIKDLKKSLKNTQKSDWIPLEQVIRSLHV